MIIVIIIIVIIIIDVLGIVNGHWPCCDFWEILADGGLPAKREVGNRVALSLDDPQRPRFDVVVCKSLALPSPAVIHGGLFCLSTYGWKD